MPALSTEDQRTWVAMNAVWEIDEHANAIKLLVDDPDGMLKSSRELLANRISALCSILLGCLEGEEPTEQLRQRLGLQ